MAMRRLARFGHKEVKNQAGHSDVRGQRRFGSERDWVQCQWLTAEVWQHLSESQRAQVIS